jgi:hypothetical protein
MFVLMQPQLLQCAHGTQLTTTIHTAVSLFGGVGNKTSTPQTLQKDGLRMLIILFEAKVQEGLGIPAGASSW